MKGSVSRLCTSLPAASSPRRTQSPVLRPIQLDENAFEIIRIFRNDALADFTPAEGGAHTAPRTAAPSKVVARMKPRRETQLNEAFAWFMFTFLPRAPLGYRGNDSVLVTRDTVRGGHGTAPEYRDASGAGRLPSRRRPCVLRCT